MCDYYKNFYIYSTCTNGALHFIRTSIDGNATTRCPTAPHERYIVVQGTCQACRWPFVRFVPYPSKSVLRAREEAWIRADAHRYVKRLSRGDFAHRSKIVVLDHWHRSNSLRRRFRTYATSSISNVSRHLCLTRFSSLRTCFGLINGYRIYPIFWVGRVLQSWLGLCWIRLDSLGCIFILFFSSKYLNLAPVCRI